MDKSEEAPDRGEENPSPPDSTPSDSKTTQNDSNKKETAVKSDSQHDKMNKKDDKMGSSHGSDSDASKDEDVSFKPEVLAAAAAQLAGETTQSNSVCEFPEDKNDTTEETIKAEENTLKLEESKKIGTNEDDESLVIDEADEDTKSEGDIAGGSEVRTFNNTRKHFAQMSQLVYYSRTN